MKRLYTDEEMPVCTVGQADECGRPAEAAIAVYSLARDAWSRSDQEGGVVFLCAFHSQTPPVDWDNPPPFPGDS